MSIILPNTIPVLSDEERQSLMACFEVREGYLYFHRHPNPSRSTVYHGIQMLNAHLIETGYDIVLFDFTDRDMVEHAMRRYLVEQVKQSELIQQVRDFVMVLDGSPLRRVAAQFFLNMFYRDKPVTIFMLQTYAEAEAKVQSILQER